MTDAQRPHSSRRARPARPLARWVCRFGLPTALIFVIMVEPPGAQTRPVSSVSVDPVQAPARQQIGLLVGRSTVITTARRIKRIALSTPEIADALVTSPREVLIHGKSPGTISLLVWNDTGQITNYDVVVQRDLGDLQTHLTQLFPGEGVAVAANGTDVVLAGTVSSKYVVEKASAVAVGYVESADNVVNLLRQREQQGVESEQVMLRVRFAEVSRTALQELGVSFFTDIFGSNGQVGRITTQQFAAPDFNAPDSQQFGPGSDGLVFSDFLNILAFNNEESIGLVIRALETRGLFQSLAEPNLITQNGTEATFLAGGEYPYPILQGVSGAVTVLFKEFGIRLAFTPTIVAPGRIQLKVAPEVSALDFSNSITISGFRVPALSTRRTETQVELNDGQTFAVAGLLDNSVTETMSKIPGLGDIPILGNLFKSRAYQKSQSELVVMITPHIIRPGSPGVAGQLPDLAQPFLSPSAERLPPPPAVPLTDGTPSGVVPAAGVAGLAPTQFGISKAGPTSTIVDPLGPNVSAPEATVAATPDPRVERERLKAEEKRVHEEDRRAAEEAKRAAREAQRADKAEQARLEVEREQAEQTRTANAKLAREEAQRAAEEAKRTAKAERKRAEHEQKQVALIREANVRQAREAATLAAVEAKRAAKAEQARLEVAQRQAEAIRKANAKQAREDERRAADEAKRAAKEAKRAAKVERKQAKQTRKAEEQSAREQQKLAQAASERAAEEAKRVAKAERKRLEVERKQADRDRKENEKRAIAEAIATAKRYENDTKQAEKLAEERAERQAELDRILADFQLRVEGAQRAVDEVDRAQQQLPAPK